MTARACSTLVFQVMRVLNINFIEVCKKLMGVVLKGISWFKWVYM